MVKLLLFILPIILIAIGVFLLKGYFLPSSNEVHEKAITPVSPASNSSQNSDSMGGSRQDLSSIMIDADKGVTMKLYDASNNLIAESFIQQSISNPETGVGTEDATQLLLSKPVSGEYKLDVSSNRDYEIDVYFYDKNGEVNINKLQNHGDKTFLLNFDKENSSLSSIRR